MGTVFEFSRPPPHPHTAVLTSPSSHDCLIQELTEPTCVVYILEYPHNPPRVADSVPLDQGFSTFFIIRPPSNNI